MIKRKLKKCAGCGEMKILFSKGCCQYCWSVGYKKPIKKFSDSHLETLKEYRIVRDEFMKANPVCQANLSGCTKKATDCHHSLGKIGKLYTDVRYFKALCRKCHDYAESHPAQAKELGLSGNRL